MPLATFSSMPVRTLKRADSAPSARPRPSGSIFVRNWVTIWRRLPWASPRVSRTSSRYFNARCGSCATIASRSSGRRMSTKVRFCATASWISAAIAWRSCMTVARRLSASRRRLSSASPSNSPIERSSAAVSALGSSSDAKNRLYTPSTRFLCISGTAITRRQPSPKYSPQVRDAQRLRSDGPDDAPFIGGLAAAAAMAVHQPLGFAHAGGQAGGAHQFEPVALRRQHAHRAGLGMRERDDRARESAAAVRANRCPTARSAVIWARMAERAAGEASVASTCVVDSKRGQVADADMACGVGTRWE